MKIIHTIPYLITYAYYIQKAENRQKIEIIKKRERTWHNATVWDTDDLSDITE